MLPSPVYPYGTRVRDLLPAERAPEEVMQLNAQLAREMRETGVTFTLADLDEQFQALLRRLVEDGACGRGESLPPVIPKQQWLQAQWAAIQKLAKGEGL